MKDIINDKMYKYSIARFKILQENWRSSYSHE